MNHESITPTFTEVADRLSARSLPLAMGEVALAAASFIIPPKDFPCRKIRHEYKVYHREPNPMQPDVDDVLSNVTHTLTSAEVSSAPTLDAVQLTRFIGTMLQFSDRTPTIRSAMKTPYNDIDEIYDYTIATARESGPLAYDQQFAFAMTQTNDVPTALWNLFLTSRQFARWRDSDSIAGLPEHTAKQKLDRMRSWYQSIGACKTPDKNGYQDVAGDTYYVWTHALARMIYDALPTHPSPLSEFYTAAFTQGSRIMSISHKLGIVSVIGTLSDHNPAARYGNSIGQLCADKMKTLRINDNNQSES